MALRWGMLAAIAWLSTRLYPKAVEPPPGIAIAVGLGLAAGWLTGLIPMTAPAKDRPRLWWGICALSALAATAAEGVSADAMTRALDHGYDMMMTFGVIDFLQPLLLPLWTGLAGWLARPLIRRAANTQ